MRELTTRIGGFLFLFLIFAIFSGCKHDPDPIIDDTIVVSDVCYEDTVYFQNDVLPMLSSTCGTAGCHNLGTAKNGVVLVDYLSVMRTGGINPGNPASSDIYKALNSSDERMPPSPKPQWTDLQKSLLLTWISQGAKNNKCLNLPYCDTTNVTYTASVLPILEQYCFTCHSGPNPSYYLDLSNFAQISAFIENGVLVGAINREPGFYPMPKGSDPLTRCEIRTIEIWIENGATNN
jgi:hypothetical protein